MPVVDSEAMGKLVELGGAEFLSELVETFLADTPGRLDEAAVAVQKGDWNEVERVGHSLGSSAAMLGATELAEMARGLEQSVVDGRSHDLSAQLARMRELYAAYVPVLRAETARLGG